MSIRKKAEELERRRAEAKKMGGEARLTRQKAGSWTRGPLLARYLRLCEGKKVERPWRKREIAPV